MAEEFQFRASRRWHRPSYICQQDHQCLISSGPPFWLYSLLFCLLNCLIKDQPFDYLQCKELDFSSFLLWFCPSKYKNNPITNNKGQESSNYRLNTSPGGQQINRNNTWIPSILNTPPTSLSSTYGRMKTDATIPVSGVSDKLVLKLTQDKKTRI